MSRVYNFSAGPSTLPEAVLQTAQRDMLDWQDSGMSVMEMSHRGKQFSSIAEKLESDFRQLLSIPSSYKVLFLQGGATGQFAAVPMNLLQGKTVASYLSTGLWSEKAIKEAKKYCTVNVAASSETQGFTSIPERSTWDIDTNSAYLHYTSNETINGVEFQERPDSSGLQLVVDMSSNILSREIDIEKYGLIYAGTQKNMGPAGVTVVIVREDLLGETMGGIPTIVDYKAQIKSGSMLNTPPTYNWYLVGLVLEWLKNQGGVKAMEVINIRKASKLYQAIDVSSIFYNAVDINCRSRMNVPFSLHDDALNKPFLAFAADNGLVTLEGHRSVGGMRASIYNAMPEQGVDMLIECMSEFERSH
ncbi:MAG: 3-phosphoserine/phosphohydroxythreonine transaminase [Methylococcaceae bacterium]